jgi:hypothetical protein
MDAIGRALPTPNEKTTHRSPSSPPHPTKHRTIRQAVRPRIVSDKDGQQTSEAISISRKIFTLNLKENAQSFPRQLRVRNSLTECAVRIVRIVRTVRTVP